MTTLLIALLLQEGEIEKIMFQFQEKAEKAETQQQYFRTIDDTRIALEKYLAKYPKAADAGRATFHIAEMAAYRLDYTGAIAKFDEYVAKFPNDPNVARARFSAGELTLNLEKDADAAKRFEEFAKLHPKDERVFYARLYLAVIKMYAKKYDEAAEALGKLRVDYKDRREGWAAALQLVVCHHVAEKPAEARKVLEEIVRGCSEESIVATAKRLLADYALLGRDAPDGRETDLDGTEFSIPKHKGKVVVLYFFAAHLPMAETEHAFLKKLFETCKGKDLVILGVSVDLEKKDFDNFKAERKPEWTVLYDGKGLDGRIARLCSVRGLPCLTVIDRKGKTRFFNISGRDLRIAVEKLLDEK